MLKKVLLVDDDRIMLRLAEKKFKQYGKKFTVLTALNGLQAIERLKEDIISLVVTDLNMPKMDGFALLAHLSENYPDIPVIILTGYSSQTSKKAVLAGGAAGFMEKPFVVEELAKKITDTLKKEIEGGILQTVPLDMFIQLVEMEQKTCTIRIVNKATGVIGVLFFKSGDLMDARIQDAKGTEAAYEIFSWENVTLSIQDTCAVETKQIRDDLQAILMEAMRLKDEAEENNGQPAEPVAVDIEYVVEETDLNMTEEDIAQAEAPAPADPDPIQAKLNRLSTEKKWLKDVYQDERWDDLIDQISRLGTLFKSGKLRSSYINCGEATDCILLPGEKTSIISVSSRCPRDRILQGLSE